MITTTKNKSVPTVLVYFHKGREYTSFTEDEGLIEFGLFWAVEVFVKDKNGFLTPRP